MKQDNTARFRITIITVCVLVIVITLILRAIFGLN